MYPIYATSTSRLAISSFESLDTETKLDALIVKPRKKLEGGLFVILEKNEARHLTLPKK